MAEQPERNGKTGGRTTDGHWRVARPASLSRGSRGQIAVMFGLSMLAIIPMMGLVFDGGNIYVQRRTAQNAADSAALAGTHALMNLDPGAAATATDPTVAGAVCTYLTANVFGNPPSTTQTTATFVDTNGLPLAGHPINLATKVVAGKTVFDCATASPNNALGAYGVQVNATIGPFQTFIAGFLGKGISGADGAGFAQATASATSTVQGLPAATFAADNSPFIVCGVDTTVPDPGGPLLAPTYYPILVMSGASPETPVLGGTPAGPPYAINQNAYGKTFLLHGGGSSAGDRVDPCGDNPSWKGLSDQSSATNIASSNLDLAAASLLGCTGPLFTGAACLTDSTTLSSVKVKNRVDGFAGCSAALSDSCVMIIPIAISSPAPVSSKKKFCVAWGAFWVTTRGTSHYGTLLGATSGATRITSIAATR